MCWFPSVWSLMASHKCHAVRKAVLCPCIMLCQADMIPYVFDTKQQWWKDPPTYQQSVPFQPSATSEHLTRNMQSEYSNLSGVPCSGQQCDILCWMGQYFFMKILSNLLKKKKNYGCTYLHINYNLCGLTLLYAQLLTSIGDHLSPLQTKDPVCPTTHLSNADLITPISGFFAQKLPLPQDWKRTLYRRQW